MTISQIKDALQQLMTEMVDKTNQPEAIDYYSTKLAEIIAYADASGTTGANLTVSIPIGDWNMYSTSSTTVNHLLSSNQWKTIKEPSVVIRNDSDTVYYDFEMDDTSLKGAGGIIQNWTSTNFSLATIEGGFFIDTNFSKTAYNRGFITFTYTI